MAVVLPLFVETFVLVTEKLLTRPLLTSCTVQSDCKADVETDAPREDER